MRCRWSLAALGVLSACGGHGRGRTGTAVGPAAPEPSLRFRHPGLLSSDAELAFVRDRIRAGAQPWKGAFDLVVGSRQAEPGRVPAPRPVVDCGPYSRPDVGCTEEKADAQTAYAEALLWTLTGQQEHARKAIAFLDAWSSVLRAHTGSNAPLQSAWSASVFVRAAEIMAHGDAAWPAADRARFASLLREVYLPAVVAGSPTANGNWELSMIEATTASAVFLDDAPLFARALAAWRARVPAYFYQSSDGPLPRRPPGTDRFADRAELIKHWYGQDKLVDGLCQETCRDLGHTLYGLSAAVNTAEIAFHQGVDLYGEQAKRITDAMELHARLLLGEPVPEWLCGGHVQLARRPRTFEIAYHHFHDRKGQDLPFTRRLITERIRPSGADHHMSWESLTHADLPP
jgi:hypothetical protein